jgi:hypothetical protein
VKFFRPPSLIDLNSIEVGIVLTRQSSQAGRVRDPWRVVDEAHCLRAFPQLQLLKHVVTHKPTSQGRRTKKECCTNLRCESGLRNNYFEGKRLTPEMFRIEQRYLLERRQLLNRAIHGWGVVYGYGIVAEASDGYKASESRSLKIHPGLALDECGRELLQAGVAYVGLEDTIVLDENGNHVDREKAFAAATQYTRAQGKKDERVCWRLSVHYAEQRGGYVQITDPCRCDHHEWDHTCETVRYVLRWTRDMARVGRRRHANDHARVDVHLTIHAQRAARLRGLRTGDIDGRPRRPARGCGRRNTCAPIGEYVRG